jgi:hypothetical protein
MLLLGLATILVSAAPMRAAGAVSSSPGVWADEADTNSVKSGGARAVRLSSVEGPVQVVLDGKVIADAATANLPLFEGTQILTGNEGRVEIQFEDGSLARVSPNSTLTLTVLQQDGASTRTEIVLNGGLAYFELQPSSEEHKMRVNYDRSWFEPSSFSVVRVAEDTPPGELAVFSGDVHLERGSSLQLDLHGGQSLSFNANDDGQYNLSETIQPDSWDTWNADRDQFLTAEAASKTAASNNSGINPGMGLSDLDANGNWYNVPGQGYIWSPYDAQNASFDPYGYGRWVYYPRYGYVWVSGYAWGYAPYECGLWNYYDSFGWGWAPGGCSPWWGGYGGYGGYGGGWGYNIGNYPRGYRPPHRPIPGPIHPHPISPAGHLRQAGLPTVPVDRRPTAGSHTMVAARGAGPVIIAGHPVEPLRPVTPRGAYEHGSNSFVSGEGSARAGYHPAPSHLGYVAAPSQPGFSGLGRPSGQPASGRSQSTYQSSGGSRQSAPSGYSGGHVASAPSAPSGGGGHVGGGGGSAPSGGSSHR